MLSSGILCRVDLVRTDVSEELSSSNFRVTRYFELGKSLAITNNRRTLRRRRNIPEDGILQRWKGFAGIRDTLKSECLANKFKERRKGFAGIRDTLKSECRANKRKETGKGFCSQETSQTM
jgi:hypothetical protein